MQIILTLAIIQYMLHYVSDSEYFKKSKTFIHIHGWNSDSGDWRSSEDHPRKLFHSALSDLDENVNFILVDWSKVRVTLKAPLV